MLLRQLLAQLSLIARRNLRLLLLGAVFSLLLLVFSGQHARSYIIPARVGHPASPDLTTSTLPRIQYAFSREDSATSTARIQRQAEVKESFVHAWNGYKKEAYGHDEVKPVSGGHWDFFLGWEASLVDALDTLWIMGMKEDFEAALLQVEKIDFTKPHSDIVPVFEITIRYLGGLLGAYDISGQKYDILLKKAIELGDFLLLSFETPNKMPIARWKWKDYGPAQKASPGILISEITSLSLEFTRLSQISGDRKWHDAVQRITDILENVQDMTRLPGLWPAVIDSDTMEFKGSYFTLGAWADSMYEYLPKGHLLIDGKTPQFLNMYRKVYEASKKHHFFRAMMPGSPDILFTGSVDLDDANTPKLRPEIQHLGCFVGGMVALGAKLLKQPAELEVAAKLTESCVWSYGHTETGIMPEIFDVVPCTDDQTCMWDDDKWLHSSPESAGELKQKNIPEGFTSVRDARYLLRPEAIESVFVMYRTTGDPRWREKGWKMFQAVKKVTRTDIAFSEIDNVLHADTPKNDRMESFFLAETLKYYYLLFSEPSLVSLDDYVLNTEAHPLKRRDGAKLHIA